MRIVLLVVCILSFNVAGQAILGINVSLSRLVTWACAHSGVRCPLMQTLSSTK